MTNPTVDRETIINSIRSRFAEDDRVYAFWLEGSDGTGKIDAYSDLDMVLDVEDGTEEKVLTELEAILSQLGQLDMNVGPEYITKGLLYNVFHLANTPSTLLLDVTIQSHSREFVFVRENKEEWPKVIFDKQGVVKFQSVDPNELKIKNSSRIEQLEGVFQQRIRAVKYAQREQFLEAFAYYHKFVLNPLVEMLRLQHTPLIPYYYLIHISRHLPEQELDQLEQLYKVQSTKDILSHIDKAAVWFESLAVRLKRSLS